MDNTDNKGKRVSLTQQLSEKYFKSVGEEHCYKMILEGNCFPSLKKRSNVLLKFCNSH